MACARVRKPSSSDFDSFVRARFDKLFTKASPSLDRTEKRLSQGSLSPRPTPAYGGSPAKFPVAMREDRGNSQTNLLRVGDKPANNARAFILLDGSKPIPRQYEIRGKRYCILKFIRRGPPRGRHVPQSLHQQIPTGHGISAWNLAGA